MNASNGRRRLLGWILALAVGASVLVYMLPAMSRYVDQWGLGPDHFRPAWLAVALGLSLVVRPLMALGWQMVLGAFGHRLPFRQSARIWMVAESCRWLPGGVWHFGSRVMQCGGHGIPMPVALASMALELLLTIVASLAFAVAGVVIFGSQALGADRLLSSRGMAIGATALLAVALVALAAYFSLLRQFPKKFEAVRERFISLRRNPPRPGRTVACLAFYLIVVALNGTAFYTTVLAVSTTAGVPWFAAIAANALAWVVGLLAVLSLAPAGLGIREGVLVLQLSVWMRLGDAVLIAILWRVLLLAVELLWLLVASAAPLVARAYLLARNAKEIAATKTCPELGE